MVKSAVLLEPRKIELRDFDLPKLGANDILVRVECVGVCATDVEIYRGDLKVPYPIIMGHEIVGYVEETGGKSDWFNVNVGDRVVVEPYILCRRCKYCLTGYYQLCQNRTCFGIDVSCDVPPHLWGGYGEYLYVPEGGRVHKISGKVSAEAACLASIIGNGVRWTMTKAEVKPDESILIMGPGPQGLASVIAAKYAGADPIILVGVSGDEDRLKLGREFGATHTLNASEVDVVEEVKNIVGELVDKAVVCTPASKAINTALQAVKPLGTVVMVGVSGYHEASVVTDYIVWKELKFIGGLGQAWNVELAVKILESRKFPIEKVVTHVYPLSEADLALRIAGREVAGENPLKVAIKPGLD